MFKAGALSLVVDHIPAHVQVFKNEKRLNYSNTFSQSPSKGRKSLKNHI